MEHAALCSREISREKVKAMVKLFGEIASGAAQKEAAIAASKDAAAAVLSFV